MSRKYPPVMADEWGAYSWLLPFDHKRNDPWQVLIDCRDYFDGLHEYAATWDWTDVGYSHIGNQTDLQDQLAATLGAYRIQDSERANKHLNPQYQHTYPDEPVIGRRHIELSAKAGVITAETVGEHLNMTCSGVYKWCSNHGESWSDRRAEARTRLANTMHISRQWAGWQLKDFAYALGYEPGAIRTLYRRQRTLEGEIEQPDTKRYATRRVGE